MTALECYAAIVLDIVDYPPPLIDLNYNHFLGVEYRSLINNTSLYQSNLPGLNVVDSFLYKRTDF